MHTNELAETPPREILQLGPMTVAEVAERIGGTAPDYDRAALKRGVVHFGPGNFARAHWFAYLDLVARLGNLEWGVTAVGVKTAKTVQALKSQGGLYTLFEADRGLTDCRLIGCVVDALDGREESEKVQEALATCRVVSLTITKDGYFRSSNGINEETHLDLDNPALQWDLNHSQTPNTAIGHIVEGLRRRQSTGKEPFVILSLDNVPKNGTHTREQVLAYIRRLGDTNLYRWVKATVVFPNTMVDRIAPDATGWIHNTLKLKGVSDQIPLLAEKHSALSIGDIREVRAVFSELEQVGVRSLSHEDTTVAFEAKLIVVNGTHLVAALLAAILGIETLDEVFDVPGVKNLLRLRGTELASVVPMPAGVDTAQYVETCIARFGNFALRDTTTRVGRKTLSKVRLYISRVAELLITTGHPTSVHAFILALVLYYEALEETREEGGIPKHLRLDDEDGVALRKVVDVTRLVGIANNGELFSVVLSILPGMIGSAATLNKVFALQIAEHLDTINELGVQEALKSKFGS